MKYLTQLLVILGVSAAAEGLNDLLPLPVPASIYGLVIMLLLLQTGVLKRRHVETVGGYLIDLLPLLFIPPAVGLLVSYQLLRPILVPAVVLGILSTVITMGVTGRVTQAILMRRKRS